MSVYRTKAEAKKLIHKILDHGDITYSEPQAHLRLKKWALTMQDCENVLRGGQIEKAHQENDVWRHKATTPNMTVIAEIISDDELVVVTMWRNK
jgi:hypothetical protein